MEFTVTINASKEKVWNALFEDKNYREWTAAFAEGSRAETDWKKGSKALFTDGKGSGMISKIAESIPNEFMSITHLGMIRDGVEDTESEEVKQWAGAFENYTLKTMDGKTQLLVEMGGADIPKEMVEYFENTWPVALSKLKAIAEKN